MANTKVTGDVIANGTISTVHLADDAITAAKLDSTATGITFADLTVDTNTLYVDAANNRVGIGINSPNAKTNIEDGHLLVSQSANTTQENILLQGAGYHIVSTLYGNVSIRSNYNNSTNSGTLNFYTAASGTNTAERMRITSGGNINLGSGSLTQVSYQLRVDSDFDDGMYMSAGSSSGNYAMYIESGAGSALFNVRGDGNVGIGTTSPSNKVHIYGVDGTSYLRFTSDVATTGSRIGLNSDDLIIENQEASGHIIFDTNSTERMRLTSEGNLALYETLQFFDDSSTPTASAFIHRPTANTLALGTNSSERLRIDSSGNVGIGTDSPSTKLHIEGASVGYLQTIKNTTAGGDYLQMLAETGDAVFEFDSGGTGGEATLNMYRDGTQYVKISADAGVNNYFNNGASVGIGTTSPSRKLYVGGAALIDGIGNTNKGTLMLGPQTGGVGKWSVITGAHYNATSGSGNGSGSAGIMMIGTFAGNGENDVVIGGNIYEANAATSIQFWTHTTDTSTAGGTRRMIITSNGNVGMGSVAFTPATGLHLYYQNSADMGSVLTLGNNGCCVSNRTGVGFKDGSYYRSGIVFETSGTNSYAGHIIFKKSSNSTTLDGTSETMRIHSNGNVGIGVANPQSEKLEVAGNIKANDVNGKFYTNAYSFANADTYSDTVSVSGHCLYEYIIEVNPNSAGSGLYADYYYGKVGIGVGWNGSAVTQYIFQDADETAPRSLYPSGGGNISITARMIYSGGVYTELAQGTTCTIRFQGFSTANYGIIYLRRLA